jgi:anaerobic magnesium-protoporphyrin IX monomethyl ester cyclase
LLSSILKSAGHEVVIADLIAARTRNIKRYISDIQNSSLIGIGATSLSWPTALDIIKQIRKIRNDVPIALGGIHPSMFDRHILRSFPVQYIIRGEAENALPILCNTLEKNGDLKNVPNLSWCNNNNIIQNSIAPLISGEELSKYPLPDFEKLPYHIYNGLSIESSRGCAFDCSFCSTSYRQSWRALPVDLFVDRLELTMKYLEKTRYQFVHVVDDEFSTDPKRVIKICGLIKEKGLEPKLIYDSRAKDLLSEGFIENISPYTTRFLVGAECGYNEGLERVGKGVDCQILEKAAAKLKAHGISESAEFSFIIGQPWETAKEIVKTIRFATHLVTAYDINIILQWYCQIPGSRQWDDDYQKQIVNETMYDNYGFFRDLYLFRTGVHLTPSEIWTINDIISQLEWLVNLRYPKQQKISSAIPIPIFEHFPKIVISEKDAGLQSLRQISHPQRIQNKILI